MVDSESIRKRRGSSAEPTRYLRGRKSRIWHVELRLICLYLVFFGWLFDFCFFLGYFLWVDTFNAKLK